MKGAVVLLEKNDVLIRTQYTSASAVRWLDGEKPVAELLSEGFQIVVTNKHTEGLHKIETLRDRVCDGYRATNRDLLDIIKILRDY